MYQTYWECFDRLYRNWCVLDLDISKSWLLLNMVYHLQPWISLSLYTRQTLISHSVGLSASYESFKMLEMQSEKADQAQLLQSASLQCLVILPGRGTSGCAVGCWAGSAVLCCVGKFDTEAKMWHGGSLDHSKWIWIKELAKLFYIPSWDLILFLFHM